MQTITSINYISSVLVLFVRFFRMVKFSSCKNELPLEVNEDSDAEKHNKTDDSLG